MKKLTTILLSGVFWCSLAFGFEPFVVGDIRVEGLQRISAGTVFNYLPLKVGDRINDERSRDAIRALFKTGFFKDVRLEREGEVLVVYVVERPSIASIDISGNKALDSEQLLTGLKDVGFAEGRVFDRSLLDKVEQELLRIYFSQGKYAVKIDTTVTPLERNRVDIDISISEGQASRIHQINIVGNKVFDDEELLDEFDLSTPTLFSFYTRSDQYSRQKLSADLERLRSYYLDRGYINFKIDSTQVSITPDKKDVYITINVTEGDRFEVKEVRLAGDLVLEQQEFFERIQIQAGDTFSRRRATNTTKELTGLLGDAGYAFANVNVIPDIDNENQQVALTFFVDPGKRAYVRRINFTGNTKTRDEVLRREMRQMEGGWVSTEAVERSRTRLQKLGYFEDVTVETPAVPGAPDQVDVNFSVAEKNSGNLLAGLGWSQSEGLILNTSVSQDNFLGTGKRVSVSFNNSSISTRYGFSFTDPYHTLDGVSRGFNVLYREIDAGEADIGDYSSNIASVGVNYGIPINEFDRGFFSMDVENTEIVTDDDCEPYSMPALTCETPQEYLDYLDENGDDFLGVRFTGRLSHDTRDRSIFATRGGQQILEAELGVGELEYYKLRYRHLRLFPLTKALTLQLKADIGYGGGFGGTSELPFWENYYAGGSKSVRGFKDNTLGPKDVEGEALGGNLLAVGNVDLIFPLPFVRDAKAWRFTTFFDFGSVWDTDVDTDEDGGPLRYSVGIGATWLSPFGALSASIAAPFNDQDDDETEVFQFSFGQGF